MTEEEYMMTFPEYWASFLPSPLPRTHPANECENCHQPPTGENPTTIYAGEPADMENGPSPRDLPVTLCERCDECPTPEQAAEYKLTPEEVEALKGRW